MPSLAAESLDRIGAVFGIERQVNGKPPDERQQTWLAQVKLRLDELAILLDAVLSRISCNSELAAAIRYARSRWAVAISMTAV